MKILLLGKNGQVGWELQRSLAPLGQVIALGSSDTEAPACGNLTLPDQLRSTLQSLRPDVIVNAAAYTAVDKAQSEPALAHQVNAHGPAVLAQEAAKLGAWLVHYSTDYVFNGSGTQPWQEDDDTDPLNVYGHSKLAGEQALRDAGCKHLLFRTSWVYAARGSNFAKTMLRLASERDSLSVINDQFGAPTGAELIADVTAHALITARHNPQTSGTYHLAAHGQTTWFDYANYVLACAQQLGLTLKAAPENVHAVASSAFPTPARRPANSRLNTQKLQATFGLHLPPWQVGVQRMLAEILRT